MTSGDPKALKRRRDKEDKLSAEGSRLARMDLDPRLYSNVRENNLTSLVSRDPITNAATICLRARARDVRQCERGRESAEVWRAAKMRRSCSSQLLVKLDSIRSSCLFLESNNINFLVTAT